MYQALLDLLRQVANILQPSHGGTGSTHGESRTVVRGFNSTGASLPLMTLVQWSFGSNSRQVKKVAATNSTLVLGVIVGYYAGDGQLVEDDCPDGYEAAVQTAGDVKILLEADALRSQYAFAAATDGTFTSSATAAAGAFGIVRTSAHVSDGDTFAWVTIPLGVSPGAGVTAHSSLTGLTSGDDHTQYQKESEKGAASGYASLDSSTKVPTAQLGSGTADSTTFLRGDQIWAAPTGVGSGAAGWTKIIDETGASFANWTSIAGTWSSDGTWIKQTNTAASFMRAYYNTKSRLSPVLIQYDFRFDSGGSGDDYAGVSLGQTTATGGVSVRPEIVSGVSQLRVEHGDGGTPAATFTSTNGVPTWTRGTTYTVKAFIVGSKVTVWVDGTLIGTIQADLGGVLYDHFRLLTNACAADFKAITVYTLDLPPLSAGVGVEWEDV